MKYGYCKNHPKIYAQNSRGLCGECTREKHRQSAESKGFTVKEKSNERNVGKDELRYDSTPKEDSNFEVSGRKSRKEGKIDFKKGKIKHRSEKWKEIIKQELLLFQKIFKERPPWCEWCKASITVFSPMNYHHLRTKGSHPELRLVESNIAKICVECHLKEHGFKPKQRIDE